MDEEALILSVLFFAPLAVALFAFISALVLFGTARKNEKFRIVLVVIGVVLMTGALGIGACYGTMFLG